MKIPEKLIGFVTYNEKQYPFYLEEDNLLLYPKDKETWKEEKWKVWEDLNNFRRKNEWIANLNLFGVLNDGKKVMFIVEDFINNDNGFISLPVVSYVVYYEELNLNSIDGFVLASDEINYFYPPDKTFETKIDFYEETIRLRQMEVKADNVEENIGEYTIDDIKINLSLQSIPTIYFKSATPFKSKSEMVISFNKPCDLDFVLRCRNDLKLFMFWICFRHNIGFKDTDIYILNQDGKRQRCGKIVVVDEQKLEKENNKQKNKRIIGYNLLKDKVADLLSIIQKGEMYFEHICENIDSTKSYDIARYIKIFAAFEREYRNLYGINYGRNEEYIKTKNEVISILDKEINLASGNRKRYLREIKRLIVKLDNSLADKIKSVFEECNDIIDVFINKIYIEPKDGEYTIIAERLNRLRNNITHANLDVEIEPIHIDDLEILQILLYCMRLKSLDVDTQTIKQAIKDLFNIRITI